MSKMLIMVLMVLPILMGWGCRKGVPPGGPDYDSCVKDEDCLSVPLGCCGCSMGGKNTAINLRFRTEWDAQRMKRCEKIMCPAVYQCGPEKPRCVHGKCVLSS